MFLEPQMSFPPQELKPLVISMNLQGGPLGIPKPPQNAFYKATELEKAGKHVEAGKIYHELLNADFDNPVLLASLGMNYAVQERNGAGAVFLRKALEDVGGMMNALKRLGVTPKVAGKPLEDFVKMKRSECLNALGTCYKHENNTDMARRFFIESQEGIPLNADIQNNLATLYINEGNPTKALEHLDLALTINPMHPQARWNKSLAHLELGEYVEGWKLYDAGFEAMVRNERNYALEKLPLWNGEPGHHVALYGEQGIGDEIMFASCIDELRKISKSVVFDCHVKLHTLFADTWPDMDIYPTREDENLVWPGRYKFDSRIAIGSLPKFFRPSLESFPGTPYIKPNPKAELEWAERLAALGPNPKVGISWIGGHKRTRVEVRSTPLEDMLPILQTPGVDFISLQYTDQAAEIAAFEVKHGIKIHQFPTAVHSKNYADTAALVANLDLVITVCTSVVHLAGAMGVPTWVLTPSRPAWRYRLDLDYIPWYGKTAVLFRQKPETTDWKPVIEEVAEALKTLQEPK
jgi:tetratricopeptide (TPR) repeat protein